MSISAVRLSQLSPTFITKCDEAFWPVSVITPTWTRNSPWHKESWIWFSGVTKARCVPIHAQTGVPSFFTPQVTVPIESIWSYVNLSWENARVNEVFPYLAPIFVLLVRLSFHMCILSSVLSAWQPSVLVNNLNLTSQLVATPFPVFLTTTSTNFLRV